MVSITIVSIVTAAAIAWTALFIKRWRRRRKVDARIIAQAKAAGVWDKQPIVLGGRALELKAWEDFKLKREPEEPDAHLRRRYMAELDKKIANTPREGDGYKAEIILCDETPPREGESENE